ncbi:putative Dynein heavy chain and region D6 of dynein motor [Trypanosoma vivax]|nr:putative Dynein heavy chain and region D6 of dynein motor [Trypanosoma vivax]
MSICVSTSAQAFRDGIRFGANNSVISVNNESFPALADVQPGMLLSSINGVQVHRVEEEQRRQHMSSKLLLVFVHPQSRRQDEFDLSSGDDDDCSLLQKQQPQPVGAMPSTASNAEIAVHLRSVGALVSASEQTGPGRCVIIMSEGVNPAYAVTVAAERASQTLMYINTVARLKSRQSLSQAELDFVKSLKKGLWIYIEQATKSMSLLQALVDSIKEARANNAIHNRARVFLMCEPHPHFPEELLEGAVTLRSTLYRGTGEMLLENDRLGGDRKLSIMRGDSPAVSGEKPEISTTKRSVKISHEVNIVPLEKNLFMELSRSATAPVECETAGGEGITRIAKYVFGANEKFISLCKVREGRYAVSTTGGYVVIVDNDGLPLIQFRPHKACLWDIAFASPFDFATACEDGTSTIFNYPLVTQEVVATSVASFQSDVFAVTYTNPEDPCSPVVSGGLSATICVLHSDRQVSSFIAAGMTVQALRPTQRSHVIVGGGSGVCSLIDTVNSTTLHTTDRHSKKVPAVASYGNVAITGGFDKMIRLWDVRSSLLLASERLMSEVVTGVAVNGTYVAACCGPDLVVWDARKFSTPLAHKQGAWKDLTRGLIIDGNIVVSASADGVTRFWALNIP